MAEQESKPTKQLNQKVLSATHKGSIPSRLFMSIGLVCILTFSACWWGGQDEETQGEESVATPTAERSQASAAITRVASTLAEAGQAQNTATPTAVAADSALVVLPTVTPTVIPSPVATRTIELDGRATLRLQLDSDRFESSGQPVVIDLDQQSYVLGGDTLSAGEEWCMQIGPTGLVFDLIYTLNPINEDLAVDGELRLFDGFCGEWGSLGNQLSTLPINIVVPAGSTAQISPAMQFRGSFMGLPNVIDISTGIFLELSFRNPRP